MHVCNSGRMCKRSHSSWLEFYNKMQVRFHWYFYPNSIVKIGQEVLAWNSLSVDWLEIVIHLFAKKRLLLRINESNEMVEPNIIFQGGRLESGSDADVCRSWLFQDFEKQDLDIVAFHFPACYNIHPQLGFPTSHPEQVYWTFSFYNCVRKICR